MSFFYSADSPDYFETYALNLRYQWKPTLSFELAVPYRHTRGEQGAVSYDLYGLSDITVMSRWDVYPTIAGVDKSRYRLWSIVGLRLGTADADEEDPFGSYIPPQYQLGTGTTDPLFGFRFSARYTRLTPALTFTYRFNSENDAGYERSDTLSFRSELSIVAARKLCITPALSLTVVPEHDRQDGAIVDGTRGEFFFLEVNAYWNLKSSFMPSLYVSRLLYATEMDSENAIDWNFGVSFLFRF